MEKREFTCIGCPMGCSLSVSLDEKGQFVSVEGFSCLVGKKYAEEEVSHPTRMVTALVQVEGCEMPLSVKTRKAIDKDKIFDCLREIQNCKVNRPIHIGDIVLKNVCETGVDVIATKEL